MVTFFHLSFTFFFEHFLIFCKELLTSDIGWLHPHKDTSQEVYKLLADIYVTIFTSPPLSVEYGGE